jgi:hypothetical protein
MWRVSSHRLLKLQVSCVDLCAIKATGSGQHAHESGFIVCKPDFKFRMSIAHRSTFRLRLTFVQALALVSESVVRPALSVLTPFGPFGTN